MRPGWVLYCDPPYFGTSASYPTPPFDHAEFWLWAAGAAAKGVEVLVSETSAPPGPAIAWEKPWHVTTRRTVAAPVVIERLYQLQARSKTTFKPRPKRTPPAPRPSALCVDCLVLARTPRSGPD